MGESSIFIPANVEKNAAAFTVATNGKRVISDLKTLSQSDNKTVPFGETSNTAVLEFDWQNNEGLFASVIEDKTQSISS